MNSTVREEKRKEKRKKEKERERGWRRADEPVALVRMPPLAIHWRI